MVTSTIGCGIVCYLKNAYGNKTSKTIKHRNTFLSARHRFMITSCYYAPMFVRIIKDMFTRV